MISLFIKELTTFFKSVTGYFVIILFLLLSGLFLWIFPGDTNILDSQFATLEPFFYIAPWVFLLLIPAITMRSVADEKKSGNLELLFTRPLSDMQIITAKFLACLALVMISLLPTLIYYISVNHLGDPIGNIDHAATWGSYLGLFFLAAVYVSIGIFSSSVSDNTIIAFLVAVVFCFIMYLGFDLIGNLFSTSSAGNLISGLSIDYHYQSVSRGVIDSRDIIYFLAVTAIFLVFTKLKFASRLW